MLLLLWEDCKNFEGENGKKKRAQGGRGSEVSSSGFGDGAPFFFLLSPLPPLSLLDALLRAFLIVVVSKGGCWRWTAKFDRRSDE